MDYLVFVCCSRDNLSKKEYAQYVWDEGYIPELNRSITRMLQCEQVWVFGDIIDLEMQNYISVAEEYALEIHYVDSTECDI